MEENNNNEKTILDKGKEIAKNEAKKATTSLMKKILPKILPAIGMFFLILLAVGVINLIPYLINQLFSSLFGGSDSVLTSGAVSSGTDSIIYIDSDGKYKLHTEDFADKVLKELENKKIDIESAGFITKNFDDMIDKYIEAEVKTMFPKTGQSDLDGMIVIKRMSAETGATTNLTYTNYNNFCNDNSEAVLNKFSLNPNNFKLCIARHDGSGGIVKEELNYQRYIQNYATPLNFFLALHVISQDEDFMNGVLDMVLRKGVEEPIVLTYVESMSVETTKIEYTGIKEVEKTVLRDKMYTDDKIMNPLDGIPEKGSLTKSLQMSQSEIESYLEEGDIDKEENDEQVTTTIKGLLYITKADTWIKSANKTVTKKETSSGNTFGPDIIYEKSNSGTEVITSEDKKVSVEVKTDEYIQISKTITTTMNNTGYVVTDENSEISADNFVELVRAYPSVEDNLTTAPSNLFYLLQQNQNTQRLEKIMRYIMYVLNDIDYGVSLKDLEYLLTEKLVEYTGVGNLRSYLFQFSHGTSYTVPQSADGKYYKMYGDGVGWPTIGDADLQWKSNYGHFEIEGKIKHGDKEIQVSNVAEYILKNCLKKGHDATYSNAEISNMEIYIEKELVDDIGDKVQEVVYNRVVENDLLGLNLARQQIYPLVAIRYNFGYIPVRNGKTFKQVYLEGAEKFEEGSWQHNRYIWDEWWCRVEGGASGHIPCRDAQFETYVKGVFDFSTSDAGTPFGRSYYIYYTKGQISRISYAPGLSITRDENDTKHEEEIFTLELMTGKFERVSGDSRFLGYWHSTMGRQFTVLYQNACSNWGYKCNRAAGAIIASGYTKQSVTELIDTMDTTYAAMGDPNVPRDNFWNLYGLKLDSDESGYKSPEVYTEILSKHLKKGGYAMIWVCLGTKGNPIPYQGKTRGWTGEMHWVAIIDYQVNEDGQEQMAIADMSGAAWYDIDEFNKGIHRLALISEK